MNDRCYKLIDDGFIIAIGTGAGGTEITVEDYLRIRELIDARPVAPEGYRYRLTVDEEWILVEQPVEEVYADE